MAIIYTTEMKKKKAYEFFLSKCSKMIDSKFLLAQPCIAGVLKCIINSPELYQFIKDSLLNIDCEAELMKATLSDASETFKLPTSKRVMVALITYLLNQFDNNEIDLMEFIAFYYNPDTNIGYQVFCQEVIVPYIEAVKDLFIGVKADCEIEEEKQHNEYKVNMAVYEQADIILKDILTEIQADNNITEIERAEYISIVEGMMVSLSNLDQKVIIAIWIGMKYTLCHNKRITKLLKELERLFKSYLIL